MTTLKLLVHFYMLRYVLIAIFEQCALGMKLSRAVSLDNEDNHSSGIVC